MNVRVNKWLDLIDRAGWTFVQASAGVVACIVFGDLDWEEAFGIVLVATAASVLKVKVGQNTGTDETGSLIGQSVIEPPPFAESKASR